jgi:hypothetical protein
MDDVSWSLEIFSKNHPLGGRPNKNQKTMAL